MHNIRYVTEEEWYEMTDQNGDQMGERSHVEPKKRVVAPATVCNPFLLLAPPIGLPQCCDIFRFHEDGQSQTDVRLLPVFNHHQD